MSFSVVVLLLLQGFKIDIVHILLEEIRVLVFQFEIEYQPSPARLNNIVFKNVSLLAL
jgi:hypothetical protein